MNTNILDFFLKEKDLRFPVVDIFLGQNFTFTATFFWQLIISKHDDKDMISINPSREKKQPYNYCDQRKHQPEEVEDNKY